MLPEDGKKHRNRACGIFNDFVLSQYTNTVYLTHNFLMELFSYGDTVKPIQPKQLIDELKEIYKSALEKY